MASATRHVLVLLLLVCSGGGSARALEAEAGARALGADLAAVCDSETVHLLQQSSAALAGHASPGDRSASLSSAVPLSPASGAGSPSAAARAPAAEAGPAARTDELRPRASGSPAPTLLELLLPGPVVPHGTGGVAPFSLAQGKGKDKGKDPASFGTPLLYVLPLIGLAAAAGAIGATVVLTQRFSSSAPLQRPATLTAERLLQSAMPQAPQAKAPDGRLPFGGFAEALLPTKPLAPPPKEPQDPPGSANPGWGVAPGRGPGPVPGTVTVVAPFPPEGGRFGLNLKEQDLTLTGFADPRAHMLGLLVGDRIVQVNGVQVSDQASFLEALQAAVARNAEHSEPIVFVAVEAGSSGEAATAKASALGSSFSFAQGGPASQAPSSAPPSVPPSARPTAAPKQPAPSEAPAQPVKVTNPFASAYVPAAPVPVSQETLPPTSDAPGEVRAPMTAPMKVAPVTNPFASNYAGPATSPPATMLTQSDPRSAA